MSASGAEAPARPPRLRLAEAVLLGALHGPAELLPISSSAHVELVPWLLGSGYTELDPDLRKSFDVALHGGAAAAMLIAARAELGEALEPSRARFIALATLPAGLAGVALERTVERRLGGPRQVAIGLIAGAVAMLLADRRPQLRAAAEARPADALAVGLGQALALMPGVSRSAATLSAARLRGFTRADASRLSRHAALPVIGGAVGLKGLRLAGRELPPGARSALAAGAAASFTSALACSRLTFRLERRLSLGPLAAYRIALGALVLARVGETGRVSGPPCTHASARSSTIEP
jgi:undecaprenyl-diphosphatase